MRTAPSRCCGPLPLSVKLMGWSRILLVYFLFFFNAGSYTPTKPENSWAVTHAGAGLTGLLCSGRQLCLAAGEGSFQKV